MNHRIGLIFALVFLYCSVDLIATTENFDRHPRGGSYNITNNTVYLQWQKSRQSLG